MISLVFKRTWDHKVDFPKTHFFIIVEENLIFTSTFCAPCSVHPAPLPHPTPTWPPNLPNPLQCRPPKSPPALPLATVMPSRWDEEESYQETCVLLAAKLKQSHGDKCKRVQASATQLQVYKATFCRRRRNIYLCLFIWTLQLKSRNMATTLFLSGGPRSPDRKNVVAKNHSANFIIFQKSSSYAENIRIFLFGLLNLQAYIFLVLFFWYFVFWNFSS